MREKSQKVNLSDISSTLNVKKQKGIYISPISAPKYLLRRTLITLESDFFKSSSFVSSSFLSYSSKRTSTCWQSIQQRKSYILNRGEGLNSSRLVQLVGCSPSTLRELIGMQELSRRITLYSIL